MLGFEKRLKEVTTNEIRMSHTICGNTLRYGMSNSTICDMTGVEKIEEFVREQRFGWFGHVKRINDERTPVKSKNFVVDGSRKRGKKL